MPERGIPVLIVGFPDFYLDAARVDPEDLVSWELIYRGDNNWQEDFWRMIEAFARSEASEQLAKDLDTGSIDLGDILEVGLTDDLLQQFGFWRAPVRSQMLLSINRHEIRGLYLFPEQGKHWQQIRH